ncbi:hypothetical protein V1511DRAFT_260039 [Dipodascopsis uninucleata]
MSLESALEEERLEILKLLESKKPANQETDTLRPPVRPSRTSRSASPLRSRRYASESAAEQQGRTGSPFVGGKITPSALVKNFNSLSPAAQELLLSSSSVPELIQQQQQLQQLQQQQQGVAQSSLSQRRLSGGVTPGSSPGSSTPSSLILPSANAELAPYPLIGSQSRPSRSQQQHHRAASFSSYSGGEPLSRHISADDEASVKAFLSHYQRRGSVSGPPSPILTQGSAGSISPSSASSSRAHSPTVSRSPEQDFSTAYRRLSNTALLKSGGKLAALATKRSPSMDARLEKDDTDEDAIESSSDEDSDASDEDSDVETHIKSGSTSSDRAPQSLMAAMEEERKAISSSKKYQVQSLIAPPPPSHIDNSYRRHLIRPKTAFDLIEDAKRSFASPYTSDTEEANDIRKAVNMPINVSDIETNLLAGRVLRTITRGDYASIRESKSKKRSYIVSTDSSPEATYALEWAIGTILRDGDIIYAVSAIEEPEEESKDRSSSSDATLFENERITLAKDITATVVKLLRKTRLQVECVIEVMHCKSPKHLLCDVIDYLNPTMVILGSRGRSALKGVLLGSFSNYLVTKSSVPVMVARKKLKKSKSHHHRTTIPVKFSNNLRDGVSSLSLAKVD